MNKNIYPCLWFNGNAKDAATFYSNVFNNTNIIADNPVVMMLEMSGQKLMLLNGGPMFSINPSISLFVASTVKDEVQAYWNKLTEGGKIMMALDKYPWSESYGWVEDKFGVSWQLYYSPEKNVHQTITPSLMFTKQQTGRAEEAIHFYNSVFPNSTISGIAKYGEGEGDTVGHVKHGQFTINDFGLMAMDSSMADFGFDEGVSIVVNCDTQEEIDDYWAKLTEGGTESMCGWLKDKFGVSWQIVPTVLGKLMSDPEKAPRVVQAFMQMKKFDIEALMNA